MRLYMIGAAFAACLTLSACATDNVAAGPPPAGAPAVPSGSTAISATAQKALYVAEALYNTAGSAYMAAETSMAPDVKARTKSALQTGYKLLKTARQAATLGDSGGVLAAVSAATTAIQGSGLVKPN